VVFANFFFLFLVFISGFSFFFGGGSIDETSDQFLIFLVTLFFFGAKNCEIGFFYLITHLLTEISFL